MDSVLVLENGRNRTGFRCVWMFYGNGGMGWRAVWHQSGGGPGITFEYPGYCFRIPRVLLSNTSGIAFEYPGLTHIQRV